MKEYKQKPLLVLKLEKDQEGNLSGMQARVWKLNNGTTILLRLFEHSEEARKNLWDGKITLGEVDELMLRMLLNFGIVKKTEHWEYEVGDVQDEFEEKR